MFTAVIQQKQRTTAKTHQKSVILKCDVLETDFVSSKSRRKKACLCLQGNGDAGNGVHILNFKEDNMMAVTGIGSNYNVYESTYASQKNEAAKKTETKETSATQSENTKSSTSGKVSDYYSHLSKNYDCVKNGNVAISGSYLRQCANDPEKAKELEENLSLFNEIRDRGYANAKQNAQRLGARLVSYSESWGIDSTGNITMTASTTVTSDTKGWKELKEEQEERLKEKKEKAEREEKIKAQKEEKQEQLEKLQERADAKEQIYVKENGAEKDMKDYATVQKDKPEDAYYPKFDMGI